MAETAEVKNSTPKSTKMPNSIWYIVGNEAAERFNYYGLRAILTTYLVAQYMLQSGMDKPTAEAASNAKTHDFVALSYLLPLFGGMIADWFWGKYKTIFWLSLVYCAGCLIFAFSTGGNATDPANLQMLGIGLILIATGAGGIKPCVSANVGDQFTEENTHLIPRAFDYFYFSINTGSLLSITLIPYLNKHFGPRIAFMVPAVAMLTATIVFWMGRNKYIKVPPKGDSNKQVIFATSLLTLIASYYYMDGVLGMGMLPVMLVWAALVIVVALIFQKQWFAAPGNFIGINLYALLNGGFKKAEDRFGAETIDGIQAVWRVLAIFAFIPFFWALWDQSTSEWVVQATKMDLNLFGIEFIAEQMQLFNALLILLFIPLFSFGIYPMVEKMGIKVTSLRKLGAGFFVTALSFVVIAVIQTWIDGGDKPNIIWQLLAYIILTAGEILISITGLEYAYTRSPATMKSTIMACYLLSVTMGNVLVSFIQKNIENKGFFAQFHGASFFWLFAGICATAGVLFALISPRIKEKIYVGNTSDTD
ncbi:MAG: hypothetical protein JNL70_09765 [Saprospiraceae bacterium]|nr:hypothetical protein [Saprospiraceae bacterium]